MRSVGSSWVTPDEDGLNDCQYATRRLSTLDLVLSPDASVEKSIFVIIL
jgi:hypothetical protein